MLRALAILAILTMLAMLAISPCIWAFAATPAAPSRVRVVLHALLQGETAMAGPVARARAVSMVALPSVMPVPLLLLLLLLLFGDGAAPCQVQ